jgi:hypothetical protein
MDEEWLFISRTVLRMDRSFDPEGMGRLKLHGGCALSLSRENHSTA